MKRRELKDGVCTADACLTPLVSVLGGFNEGAQDLPMLFWQRLECASRVSSPEDSRPVIVREQRVAEQAVVEALELWNYVLDVHELQQREPHRCVVMKQHGMQDIIIDMHREVRRVDPSVRIRIYPGPLDDLPCPMGYAAKMKAVSHWSGKAATFV